MEFIGNKDFTVLTSQQFNEDAIFWKDLPIGVIFRIDHVYPMEMKFGRQIVLTLVTHEDNVFRVFATPPIKKALKNFGKSLVTTYIKSLGIRRIATNSGNRKFYDFEIVENPIRVEQ